MTVSDQRQPTGAIGQRYGLGTFALTAAALLMMGNAPAAGQSGRVNLGTLTCTVAEEETPQRDAAGEQRSVRCVFRAAAGGAEQTYGGSITRVGSDRIPNAKAVMIWAVWGPEEVAKAPGALEQSYVGQSAEGQKAPTQPGLVGRTNRNISLQPSTVSDAPSDEGITVLDLQLMSVPA